MPLYEYKCEVHGYFTKSQRIADHARAECPTCGLESKQVLRGAPALDITGMSKAGCPGAWNTVGDRLTRQHTKVPQAHRPKA